jgi:hypothetical protein
MDLHCGHIKFAELIEPGIIEVKCRSNLCGAGKGVVVLHQFDADTGDMISTRRFKEPKGVTNGSGHGSPSVRPA